MKRRAPALYVGSANSKFTKSCRKQSLSSFLGNSSTNKRIFFLWKSKRAASIPEGVRDPFKPTIIKSELKNLLEGKKLYSVRSFIASEKDGILDNSTQESIHRIYFKIGYIKQDCKVRV